MISARAVGAMDTLLRKHEDATGDQILFAFFDSLEGEDLVDYVQRVFQHWKLGSKDAKNGVLIAVFIKDRKARIEVGYGLEPVLTDAMSMRVLDQSLFPQLKAGRPEQAVVNSAVHILSILKSPVIDAETVAANQLGRRPKPALPRAAAILITLFFVGLFIFFTLGQALSGVTVGPTRRRNHWGGGGWGSGGGGFGSGGGGGFGGGGGGSSGGGGASGSW